jgi:glycosyltransferase involved in cell wall biosynthesis
LTGSGSNVYTSNIARVWRAAGHDVLVVCQERAADGLPYVDASGDFAPDNGSFNTRSAATASAAGRCVVVRPSIGRLLPVYVYDDYEGFDAKLFTELDDTELDHYVGANVTAMVTAIQAHDPHAIITGHEVMGPYIAKLACEATGTTYVAKLHGSGLEYAVKKQERYRAYAAPGLGAAAWVVGGSKYMLSAAAAEIPGWTERGAVVNPGCDVELFRPAAARSGTEPIAGFVGKLILAKGVHHYLAALGLTRAPGLRSVIVGYGGDEELLRNFAAALTSGARDEALAFARRCDPHTAGFIDSVMDDEDYWHRAAAVPAEFTGRLEHGPLAKVLPHWDLSVAPSVVPEAFGMVAAEAAACGVLPVVPSHSGIGEAGAAIEAAIGQPGALTFDHTEPIPSIASRIDRLLAIPSAERDAMGLAASRLAEERWSWHQVARSLLELALSPGPL